MILIKASRDSEAGVLPSDQLLTEMGKFNEELVQAGVMQAGEGLHPSSKDARVRFSGPDRSGKRSLRSCARRRSGCGRRSAAALDG